jgi:hypothetical protein
MDDHRHLRRASARTAAIPHHRGKCVGILWAPKECQHGSVAACAAGEDALWTPGGVRGEGVRRTRGGMCTSMHPMELAADWQGEYDRAVGAVKKLKVPCRYGEGGCFLVGCPYGHREGGGACPRGGRCPLAWDEEGGYRGRCPDGVHPPVCRLGEAGSRDHAYQRAGCGFTHRPTGAPGARPEPVTGILGRGGTG